MLEGVIFADAFVIGLLLHKRTLVSGAPEAEGGEESSPSQDHRVHARGLRRDALIISVMAGGRNQYADG